VQGVRRGYDPEWARSAWYCEGTVIFGGPNSKM
jgi:hypothetical protein